MFDDSVYQNEEARSRGSSPLTVMDHYDHLIVGNGVAGTTAAETVRAYSAAASIAIVSDEPHPLYSRVLLPNYVQGLISRERVFLRTTEEYAAKGIVLLGGARTQRLDTKGRTLHLADGRAFGFGTLLIAGGGRPRPLGIQGEAISGISRFQTIEDADRMLEALGSTRRAVVIGGSFIALEYLNILVGRGVATTLVIPGRRFFERFLDEAGSGILHENFMRHGINVITEDRPAALEGKELLTGIQTAGGRHLEADFLGAGIGLDRNIAWLDGSGVRVSDAGVITDEFLTTNVPGVFAAGDIADFNDIVLGFRHSHGNWGNAFRQGELAGRNMASSGVPEPYRSVTSYGIRNLDLHIALVGYADGGPGIEAVIRFDSSRPSYGRFLLAGERMVGAALINRPEDRAALTTLIRDAVPLGDAARTWLADPGVDIASLVA